MYYTQHNTPIGKVVIQSDGANLTGLWFTGQKYFGLDKSAVECELPIFAKTKELLNAYFMGKNIDFKQIQLKTKGSKFQELVWNILKNIPYGKFMTYGEIANQIAKIQGTKSVSAQAVGGAVGHNPISIIVPCHRVLGKGGKLTGYAGGLDKKLALLKLEGIK